jgi:limonene 1,2-monooxygenase
LRPLIGLLASGQREDPTVTYKPQRMRFGAFIAPFHALGENPTLAFERDMQLVQHLDALDFDEAWIGEHHSAGVEIIGSPELLIAAIAERTRRIRLGTGVNSLSYHHPFILADRLTQLDHQTRGRIMFGVGPGQLPSDAFMMGIDPVRQRDMMAQALEAILGLLEGRTVTMDAGWFKLDKARLHILPYQAPRMEMAVACTYTPNGPVLAGKHGLSMLSVAASSSAGFAALPDHFRITEQVAAEHGRTASRESWRVVAPMHVAETREQAIAEVAAGVLPNCVDYMRRVGGKPMQEMVETVRTADDAIALWTTQGFGPFGVLTVGTPDDAAARIAEFQAQSGGFGTFLILAQNAAPWAATQRSYEMFARYVAPRFQHSDRRADSLDFAEANSDQFIGAMVQGIGETLEKHGRFLKPA